MDLILWLIVAVAQVLIGLLSVLAGEPEIVAAFIFLSMISLVAAGYSAIRASKFNDMVARLTRQVLFEIKGSPDGYLVIHPTFMPHENYENGIAGFSYYNESEYPMIDSNVSIVGSVAMKRPAFSVRLGDVLPDRGDNLRGLTVQLRKDVDNSIDFSIVSRSAILWEHLVITWNGEGWVSDYSLFKEVDRKEVYLKSIRDDFPYIRKQQREKDFDQQKVA